jgi:hypothetical protein
MVFLTQLSNYEVFLRMILHHDGSIMNPLPSYTEQCEK